MNRFSPETKCVLTSLMRQTLTSMYHDRRGEVVDVLEDDAGRRPGTSVTTFYIGFNSTMARKWTFGGGTFDRSESGGGHTSFRTPSTTQ